MLHFSRPELHGRAKTFDRLVSSTPDALAEAAQAGFVDSETARTISNVIRRSVLPNELHGALNLPRRYRGDRRVAFFPDAEPIQYDISSINDPLYPVPRSHKKRLAQYEFPTFDDGFNRTKPLTGLEFDEPITNGIYRVNDEVITGIAFHRQERGRPPAFSTHLYSWFRSQPIVMMAAGPLQSPPTVAHEFKHAADDLSSAYALLRATHNYLYLTLTERNAYGITNGVMQTMGYQPSAVDQLRLAQCFGSRSNGRVAYDYYRWTEAYPAITDEDALYRTTQIAQAISSVHAANDPLRSPTSREAQLYRLFGLV